MVARGESASPAPRVVFSLGEQETFEIGRTLARTLRGGELILLEGDLGLGKTVIARGIAVGLGVPAEEVSSPSFTLIQEYRGGRLPMFHVDLYRLGTVEEVETLGLDELLLTSTVVVVEWGERLPASYVAGALTVRLHDVGAEARRIEIFGRGDRAPRARADA